MTKDAKSGGHPEHDAEGSDASRGHFRARGGFVGYAGRFAGRQLVPSELADWLPSGRVARYVTALAFLTMAVSLRIVMNPWLGNTLSHPTVFTAVLLATWYCGTVPAILVAALGYPAIELLVRDVPFSGWVPEYLAASLGLYVCLSIIIVLFVASFRRERDKLREAERTLHEAQEQFRQLADHIPEAFWITDVKKRRVIYISPACERIHGAPLPPLRGILRAWRKTLHPEDRGRVLLAHRRMAADALDVQYRMVRPDGSTRWLQVRGYPVKNPEGRVYRVAGTIEDITERRNLEQRLHHQAHFDSLTGLPNRTLFFDRLTQALNLARRAGHFVSVLFVDIDRFKSVNDTFGHLLGDKLLQRAGECLTQSVRAEDTVARLGGDEFGIILPHVENPEHAALVARKALGLLSQPFQLEGRDILVTASIGVAISSPAATDAQTLVKNADTAMFRVKTAGRNGFEAYTSAMNERALQQLDLERRLRRAVEAREFVLHFQPKKSIAEDRLTGCEALLRWIGPQGTVVGPLEFVPALEESGLIRPVGEWVVHAACRQIAEWQAAGIEPLPVAVNLSPKQFAQRNLAAVIENALREHAVEPRLLEIELTETAAMQNTDETILVLGKLKALGVKIAIDDFGTGHSSLSYLKRLPIDVLKIDSSFITGLPDNDNDASITKAIITMAHNLGLSVIAEGVEYEAQAAFLAENGCDEMQGFLLSRPVSAAELARLSREHARSARPPGGADTIH